MASFNMANCSLLKFSSLSKTSEILKTSLVGGCSTIFRFSAFSANEKHELMPSVPVYIGEANCEEIRKVAEKTG
jgi:hypothetical protein